jgi:hypothetical protein
MGIAWSCLMFRVNSSHEPRWYESATHRNIKKHLPHMIGEEQSQVALSLAFSVC